MSNDIDDVLGTEAGKFHDGPSNLVLRKCSSRQMTLRSRRGRTTHKLVAFESKMEGQIQYQADDFPHQSSENNARTLDKLVTIESKIVVAIESEISTILISNRRFENRRSYRIGDYFGAPRGN